MKMLCRCLLLVGVLFACQISFASEPKVYIIDWGVGVGGQHLNDYRGSRETQVNALPFPFLIYHGDILKVDEEDGFRAELLHGERFEINISGDSALRSSSDENKLRQGMEPLDSVFQLGPSFNVLLFGDHFEDGLTVHFPLRAGVAVNLDNFGMSYVGYNFSPELTYKKRAIFPRCNFRASIGAIHGSRKYHDYYYSIDSEYITDDRSAYQAEGGYGGVFSELGLYAQKKNWLFRFSLRYDNMAHATFNHSDLVETENYFSLGFGIGWLFHKTVYQSTN